MGFSANFVSRPLECKMDCSGASILSTLNWANHKPAKPIHRKPFVLATAGRKGQLICFHVIVHPRGSCRVYFR